MKIRSKLKDYSIEFVDNLESILNDSESFYIVDSNVFTFYKSLFTGIKEEQLLVIDSTEDKKNIQSVLEICDKMTMLNAKRNVTLVSIGGGIVQDITGFAANILYRGIKWIFYPSTLLAACDSCIGGKTSLNYNNYKNLLGTFYPPDIIYIYPDFFKTLSDFDFYSGLGEVVKFNIMNGLEGLKKIEQNINSLIGRDSNVLKKFVFDSLDFKSKIIEEDEFDNGKRIFLNFGHTFGHAFETVSNYNIPHGSAVAMGIITANSISVSRNILDKKTEIQIATICKSILQLQLRKEWFNIEDIITVIKKDKKQIGNSLTAILMSNNDFSVVHDITISEIEKALQRLIEILEIK